MKLSSQQEKALDAVGRWLRNYNSSSPYFMLAGYAGTGKTTIARRLAESASGPVYYAAYTGKAAHVLRRTGVQNASTIHRLIYTPRDKCDEHLRRLQSDYAELLLEEATAPDKAKPEIRAKQDALRKKIEAERANLRRPDFNLNTESPLGKAALVVIDEYSMVDEQTGRDLLSFHCPILALGDPGQLPPVQGRRFFAREPDALLTEIHRQAAENPIIRLSMDVREGRTLKPGTYGSSSIRRRATMSNADIWQVIQASDQLLVGTNATRAQFNQQIRKMYGRQDPYPMEGDKLVCLRNNHQEGLLNGQIFTVTAANDKKTVFLQLRLVGEDGEKVSCLVHRHTFKNNAGAFPNPAETKLANEFDYGYALTVHKAQGSQWNKVALVDEWKFKDRKQWLYTAITRAAESVTIMV